ncbi:MAG: Outer membrane protein A precursor [uncultured Paraburkholderia sp.]|uniref:OmpA family protein n=1 Tax=uncultured Paraburkholderia sp. TaxID=1822466 RepID=UPI00259825E2|nr:OmpA family protein [uncultured Paraburkholderia sp.]CAH2902886.1 MAG: Outer membrane protein A precursor [uncultured Paraburkholderia sp.]CAH2937856.1 MAG: Outer membrane protein A precursor [uncultured Paraburkholderia sp.]
MKTPLTVLVCALTLTACADHAARARLGIQDSTLLRSGVGASQDEAAGAANPQWVQTYAIVHNGASALASLQARLDRMPPQPNDYFRAKAQCWINAAQQTRQAGDHWGFAEEAIGEAAVITMGLESGKPVSAANPALRTVSTVRPDLWQIVNTIKSDPAVASCHEAQPPLACAEVELMQAGHDAWMRSFSNAEKRLSDIQDNLRKSAERVLQCKQNVTVNATTPNAKSPRTVTLRADALFRFNGSNDVAMLPAGRRALDAVARGLKTYAAPGGLTITGYSDRLGDTARNQSLSLQRAETVARYLRTRGVTSPIATRGLASANPLVECRQTRRDDLVRCLAPNRRVEIELVVAAP